MNKEKYVDESWKEQASQEKDVLSKAPDLAQEEGRAPKDEPAQVNADRTDQQPEEFDQSQGIEVNFLNYITSLGFQAMIFLGEIPNPMTNANDKNLTQAKFLIDTLVMLREKTEGNLIDQEKSLLENSIYELQMRYVQISQDTTSPQKEEKS